MLTEQEKKVANISSMGRFSSQMLSYFGVQRSVNAQNNNTYKYNSGPVVYSDPASASQAALGKGVIGNYSSSTYDYTRCYFISRGASDLMADTMSALIIDVATTMGVSTQMLLSNIDENGRLLLSSNAYAIMNAFRDSGNQVSTLTTASNSDSLQAREIRA